jgi:biotin carboxyl carrier protein
MPAERPQVSLPPAAGTDRPTTGDLIDRLVRFDGPPEEFLTGLLALECQIGQAEGGAILPARAPDQPAQVLAVYPAPQPGATAPVWLAQAVELSSQAIASGAPLVRPLHRPDDLYGQPARRHLVLLVLRSGDRIRGAAAFVLDTSDPAVVAARRERLEVTLSLLSLYEMRLALSRRQSDLERLRRAMETLAAVNDQGRFAGAAMALVNEVSARWQSDRVSLGFLKGRYVHVRALSHTEKFSRKMKLVQDIESAMEECLDQDVEILHPAAPDSTYVSRATAQLSHRHGPTAVLGLPMRHEGQTRAVLLLERAPQAPFTLEEVEALRLTCDLCAARLMALERQDRWFGARAASAVGHGLGWVVGPKHTWVKVLALAILAGALALVFAKGEYRADAPFVLEATTRQVIPAPFDGYLEKVFVEPGSPVEAHQTVLGNLETTDLKLNLAGAQAEREGALTEAAAAMRDSKTAEEKIAQLKARVVEARIELLQRLIRQAAITSPTSGVVISGDLKRQVGSPVQTGQVLFEVAPLQGLYAELSVPEDLIAEVQEGQAGELATASYPDRRIPFRVKRINPVAEVVNQRNVFKVRVELGTTYRWMRPGMEGVAKVDVGRRHYVWIWTRRLVNWVRMTLWI